MEARLNLFPGRVSFETGLLNKIALSSLPSSNLGSRLVGRLTSGSHCRLLALPPANLAFNVPLLLGSFIHSQLLAVIGDIFGIVLPQLFARIRPRRALKVRIEAVTAVPAAKAITSAIAGSLLKVFVLQVLAFSAEYLTLPLCVTGSRT